MPFNNYEQIKVYRNRKHKTEYLFNLNIFISLFIIILFFDYENI